MPIGDYAYDRASHPLVRALVRLFGTVEFHTPYRLAPLVDFFHRTLPRDRPVRAIEIGCWQGLSLFEMARISPTLEATGYDLDAGSIAVARRINDQHFGGRLRFEARDAFAIAMPANLDYVLFIDFLEHFADPRAMIAKADAVLRPGGQIVISVPTPRYPLVFGRKFHTAIGHLVDGYTVETLDPLFPLNYRRIETAYSTGRVVAKLCTLYYRDLRIHGHGYGTAPKRLAAYASMLFRPPDVLRGPRWACGLFAVYEKRS